MSHQPLMGSLSTCSAIAKQEHTWMVELALVIDVGEHFAKATCTLESDGPLVFSCFEIVSTVHVAISSPLLSGSCRLVILLL